MVKKVAIVGRSFRLPDHTNKNNYWENLNSGKDLVTQVNSDRWSFDTYLHPSKQHPGTSYTFAAGSLGDVSQFDAQFFGISPREAELMDPQQRLLLMLAWEAVEDAGIPPTQLRGQNVGVYIGLSSNDYSFRMADDTNAVDSSTATGNTASIAANRLSYALDLRGPSMALDTACSSSLVAFHQACLSIRSGETTTALAGGISLHLHPYGFIGFSKASMLSPTGRCQVFDAAGDGYVRSEGGGLFLLKDYDLAVADGDRILAVVLNSGVNTDGHKQGITVPSHMAQSKLITATMRAAGLDPDDLDYVEAHGTGTAIGDPIETRAIGLSLGQNRSSPLPIGSVKSNMGHLETASGAAGLIKLLYAFEKRVVPPTIGIKTLNPHIDFEGLNLAVNQQSLALPTDKPLRMSINSFGFGGSNAHIILESPPNQDTAASATVDQSHLPILLSAKSESSLKNYAQQLAQHLQSTPEKNLYDIAYQLYQRRDIHAQRALLFASSAQEAIDKLQALAKGDNDTSIRLQRDINSDHGPVFVFSGNGSQWQGMGKELLQHPVFLESTQELDRLFMPYGDFSLEAELRGQNGDGRYERTDIAQPALFALQVGLVKLCAHYGVKPAAVIGHSVGEVAAAWACGALSLEQAVLVIFERSRLQQTTQGQGQMTAVSLAADAMLALLTEHQLQNVVSIAGANSSNGCTIAGLSQHLDQIEALLREQGVRLKRLDLDYAFHSPYMDPIKDELLTALADLNPAQPTIPMYSVVKGALVASTLLDAEYWWLNIRQPVLFEPAMNALLADGYEAFMEIGPHPVLRSYVQHAARDQHINATVLTLGQRNKEDLTRISSRIHELLLTAQRPSLDPYFPCVGQFVDLPHYAWDLESYWHPVTPESYSLISRKKDHHLLGYALPQQHQIWESQLDTLLHPYLAEHVVGDAVLLPGAAFLEIALAAAQKIQNQPVIALENLTITTPLVLQEQPSKRLRTYVDEEDGRFRIRSKTVGEEESWTEHAQGRLIEAANNHWQHSTPLVVPNQTPDFDRDSHHALTQVVGLNYGPAFTAVHKGWIVDEQHIITELALPENIQTTLDDSLLHPALVDSCFQSIIHLLQTHPLFGKGVAFVPVQLEHAYVRTDLGPVHYARTQFLRLNPHSLCANFDLYNKDGVHMAHLSEVRFRSARLQKADQINLSYLDYVATPQALITGTAPKQNAVLLGETVQQAFDHIATTAEQSRFVAEIDPLLDSLADLYTQEAVYSYQQQQAITRQHLADLRQREPQTHGILQLLIHRLEQIEVAQWQDDQLQLSAPEDSANDLWLSVARDYSEAFNLFLMVARVGMHLHEVLLGQQPMAKLRPKDATLATQLQSPLGTHNAHYLLEQIAQQLQQQQQNLAAGQRLRVLEISALGPWYAGQSLAVLDKNLSDYHYACTNPEVLEQLQDWTEDYPHLHCDLINLEQLPTASFDVVLIAGDFADPIDAQNALLYAQHALLPNGSCLLYGVHSSYWQSLSYLDLPYHGVLPQEFWTDKLSQHIAAPQHYDLRTEDMETAYALIAQKPESDAVKPSKPQKSWYMIADTPVGQALASQLQALLGAENSYCVSHFDANDIKADQHILYLGGLQPNGLDLIQTQQNRCADLMQLLQNYPHEKSSLWIVCNEATAYTMPTPLGTQQTDLNRLSDAAVWGFGRSLMNESDKLQAHLVDLPWLDNPTQIQQFAQLLAQEINHNSLEQEVMYQTDGSRYVPRLQTTAAPEEQQDQQNSDLRLHFSHAGQLRNLHWQHVQLPALKAQDVQVRIHATGLNFRDVMYTLGMLSDEAVEHGFAGASLGLEFSGVVESVGSEVADFRPGDRVVGFGSHSFGTRTISQSSAMAPLPDFIGYEAAATIPSTFFTVYYALHHLARLEPGERVLIHGAAGGVGIAAVQLATHLGAEIYATASSDEKRDFLRLMGVKHIYDSRSLNFADDILADTQGEGVDVVLNSLAGEAVNRNLHVLRPFGRLLELGKRDFYQNSRIGLRPFRNNISYFGIDADQLMQAKPALTQRLFKEVMELMASGALAPLPFHLFDANQVIDAFRYMQQARQIGKIVVTYEQSIRHVEPLQQPIALELDPQATYVVTGGLGGFGLRTAQWLVEKGAKNLALLSRRGANSEEAQQALIHFEQQGVHVAAIACDVTQSTDVAAAFAQIKATKAPIKGIIHAATVIDDALIVNMSAEQIQRVLEPKVLGALHLHEHSLELEQNLDFFVVYSSATTLFGNLGQSNYVAANYWLEALMGLRQKLGLAATNVRWGAIDDVGFLARNSQIKEALQGRMGGGALPAALALSALEQMLSHNRSALGVMELDWSALDRFLPTAQSPKFSDLAHLATQKDHDSSHENWVELLATLSPEALQEHVEQLIKAEVSEILRLPAARIDRTQSIYDMGLDSLLGVELVLALEGRFGVRIPVMSLNESPTIERLAHKLISLLQGGQDGESSLESQVAQLAAQHDVEVNEEAISHAAQQLASATDGANTRIIH